MIIDGKEYIEKDKIESNNLHQNTEGLTYAVIRAKSAGCFVGYIKKQDGMSITLLNARRLWYWDGAFTLSTIAVEGVSKPENCKFPCEVPILELNEVIEIIHATDKCKKSIDSVEIYKP